MIICDDLRRVSKDDVCRDPQDDVWSAVIMNIPEKKAKQGDK